GIPDGPQDPSLQVLLANDVVYEPVLQGIEEHAVDGKVPPQSILPGSRERHGIRMPAVAVRDIRSKGSDFDFGPSLIRFRPQDPDAPKPHPHGDRRSKQPAPLLRTSVRSNVVVFWLQSEQLIAHATAGPERLVLCLAKAANYFDRKFTLSHCSS